MARLTQLFYKILKKKKERVRVDRFDKIMEIDGFIRIENKDIGGRFSLMKVVL